MVPVGSSVMLELVLAVHIYHVSAYLAYGVTLILSLFSLHFLYCSIAMKTDIFIG